jgi:CBS domain-containing protein
MKVGELCVREVRVAAPADSVEEAALAMDRDAVGTLVVVDDLGRPIGIVTDRDVAVRCIVQRRHPRRTRIEEVMSGPVAWTHQSTSLDAALEEMARLRVRRLAVVDDRERLVGLLALDDVLRTAFEPESAIGRVLHGTM